MKRLRFFPERCTTCRECELICSAAHESVFNPGFARLHILGHYTKDNLVVKGRVCNLCRLCVKVCPTNALTAGPNGLEYKADLCTGCGDCVDQCPQGVISLKADGKIRYCDLCGGEPQCVAWCRKDALQIGGEKS